MADPTAFARFGKAFASTGTLSRPTDTQADTGLSFLGNNPPTFGLHNALWNWNDEKDNWLYGQMRSIIQAAGGTPAAVGDDQLRAAILSLVGPGRLLGYQVFKASGMYVPSPGTKTIIVDVQAGGGAGGGGGATGPGLVSLGAPGAAGAWAQSILGIAQVGNSVPVTVGFGGAPATGQSGGNGGLSSFGVYISCEGGRGGVTVSNIQAPGILPNQATTANPLGGNIAAARGIAAAASVALSAVVGQGGGGGSSSQGDGAPPTGTGPGTDASNFGSGGGGVFLWENWQAVSGGRGAPGIVVVAEFT